ncbi:MAG: HD domain-containing protein [Ruminococcaceae bacterium]|nr:HD domain-containing protein [Oscillospiraceae bacterium]
MENFDLIASIKNKYLNSNKEDVLKHAENVAELAVGLANAYDLDTAKTKLAALLHDISGIMTPQEMYDFAIARGLEIDPAEEKYHALLHQRVSKIIAQEEYGITDSDILNAIECHTTLRKNAGMYDKIIFIADKISWDQKGVPSYDDLLKSANVGSLNEACYLYIKYQFDNNLLVMPHQWLEEAYDDLGKKTNFFISNIG